MSDSEFPELRKIIKHWGQIKSGDLMFPHSPIGITSEALNEVAVELERILNKLDEGDGNV